MHVDEIISYSEKDFESYEFEALDNSVPLDVKVKDECFKVIKTFNKTK